MMKQKPFPVRVRKMYQRNNPQLLMYLLLLLTISTSMALTSSKICFREYSLPLTNFLPNIRFIPWTMQPLSLSNNNNNDEKANNDRTEQNKVEIMASFLSLQLTKSIYNTVQKQAKERKSEINNDTNSTIRDLLDNEIPISLHAKEGDRVVALKDEFAPENICVSDQMPEIVSTNETKEIELNQPIQNTDDEQLKDNEVDENIQSLITNNMSAVDAIKIALDDVADTIPNEKSRPKDEVKEIQVQNFVPSIPNVISLGFGRALPIIQKGVPPLRQTQNIIT